MTVSHDTEYRGRKQKVGSVLLNEQGRLCYFLGYCPTDHGKVTVTPDEMRMLIRRFGRTRNRPVERLARKVLGHYADY